MGVRLVSPSFLLPPTHESMCHTAIGGCRTCKIPLVWLRSGLGETPFGQEDDVSYARVALRSSSEVERCDAVLHKQVAEHCVGATISTHLYSQVHLRSTYKGPGPVRSS